MIQNYVDKENCYIISVEYRVAKLSDWKWSIGFWLVI